MIDHNDMSAAELRQYLHDRLQMELENLQIELRLLLERQSEERRPLEKEISQKKAEIKKYCLSK